MAVRALLETNCFTVIFTITEGITDRINLILFEGQGTGQSVTIRLADQSLKEGGWGWGAAGKSVN